MSKLSPRAKFIKTASLEKVAAYAWDAMQLASSHDPDHEKRLAILERQVERLGAPQYRTVRSRKKQ